MSKLKIIFCCLLFTAKLCRSTDANLLIRSNLYLNNIYLSLPNISYGLGGNYEIFKNVFLGAEITLMNMKLSEEGYGIGPNGLFNYYYYYIKQSYFLPEINLKYFLFSNNLFRIALSLGDQATYIYYVSTSMTVGSETGGYTSKEILFINNSLKISSIVLIKFLKNYELEIQPFYMKNTKNFRYNRTNYGFQFGLLYNF